MANYIVKGADIMRALAQRGGQKNGETRRKKKVVTALIAQYAREHDTDHDPALLDVRPVKRPNLSGGSHDSDWPCSNPDCHRNSIKRRSCAKCFRTPANGRWTRARLRERVAEHNTKAISESTGANTIHPH